MEYEVNLEGQEVAETTTDAAPKVKKAKKEKVERVVDSQNGITRPREGTSSHLIWSTATSISDKKGAPALASEVKAALIEAGHDLNGDTISTQHNRWRKYHGLVIARAAAEVAPADTAA